MSDRRHFVGVAAAEHVARGVDGGFCMFAHGSASAAARLNPGDIFACYAPRRKLVGGEPVRAFVAIGEVLDGPMEATVMDGGSGTGRHALYATAMPADVYPLLDRFSFVKNRTHWSMYFRGSLFSVDRDDMALIAQAMGTKDLDI